MAVHEAFSLRRKGTLALLIGFVAMLAISIGSGGISSSAATTSPAYPMQSSINWRFIQGTDPGNSYFTMNVTAFSANSAMIPNHLDVSFISVYAGNAYYSHGCSLNYGPGQTRASCYFTVPFKFNGNYDFGAVFKDNSGRVVAKSIVDPLCEPAWHNR